MTIVRNSEHPDNTFSVENPAAQDGAGGVPLLGNTGVHLSLGRGALSVDTLTMVAHAVTVEQVAVILRSFGFDSLTQRDYGSRWCEQVYDGAHGLRVEAVPRDEKQNYVIVTLMGEGCQWLGSPAVRDLMIAMQGLCDALGTKLNFSRCDVAADTQEFEAAWFERAYFEGAVETRTDYHDVRRSSGGGFTFYLGSPTSDKRLRVYHKMDGSTFGDGVHFTRVEMQFRDKPAAIVAGLLMETDLEGWGALAAGWLNGYAKVNKRWWRTFLGTVEKAAIVCARRRSTVEKTMNWIERQVAPAFALVYDALNTSRGFGAGMLWLEELKRTGRQRRTPLQDALVRENRPSELPTLAIYNLT